MEWLFCWRFVSVNRAWRLLAADDMSLVGDQRWQLAALGLSLQLQGCPSCSLHDCFCVGHWGSPRGDR